MSVVQDRFSSAELLLKATQPAGYDEYFIPRSQIFGKEVSLGYYQREDMLGNFRFVQTALEFANEGQIDLFWDWMALYQNDQKASLSIDAKFLESLTTQEMRYNQTQHLYEHQMPVKKRGWLR